MSCNQTAKKSNWQTVKLGDIIAFNPLEKLRKGGVAKKVAMEKLNPFTREISGFEKASFSGGTKFKNGDTLLARITPCLENGKTAQVNILDDGEIGFGSTEFIVLRSKAGITNKDFIYYLAISPKFREIAIQSMVGSSGRQRVQQSVVEDTQISLPPLEEQEAIAGVLSSLDDKIELNNKINQNLDWEDYFSICHRISELEEENQNLEAQAQAIFKSWFVDFEPFKNGKFIDSELGKIPVGWEVKRLGNICNCVLGGTPNRAKPEYWNGNISWINSGKVNEFRIISESEFITELGLKKSATKLLPRKTTLFAITGATLGQVSLLEIESCANQSVVGVIENASMPYEYIYPFALFNIKELINHQTGGAQQHINKDNIESLKIIVPTADVLINYKKSLAPLYSQITNNVFESQRLAQLRDTLLPKLMSGEIDVSEVAV